MQVTYDFGKVIVVLAIASGVAFSFRSIANGENLENDTARQHAKPVEPDMHEFMEYVFQPTYKRLKPLMANTPADNAVWKGIKAESLTLAEGGNLLLSRLPEKDREKWTELSIAVRESGGELYSAAKKKDYQGSRKHYEAMLTKCNACHTHFANGEHQLTP